MTPTTNNYRHFAIAERDKTSSIKFSTLIYDSGYEFF